MPHTYQQITGNKSYILQCYIQIPENHRPSCQQIVHLAMPHADTSKSQSTSRASCLASHRYQKNHRQQLVILAMPHTGTSKSQATNRTSEHASHRYQQITGNKSYILPCLTQIPANHRHQILHLTMPHRYQQITGDESYILPCLTQIPASHRQQIVHLAMPHTDTSKSQAQILHLAMPHTQIQANHRQQIVHLAMPHTDTIKSQATNRTSYHASHRCQQHTGIKSYILPCLTQIPASHRQQIVHLTMPHTDTSKSQTTNRTSCHASHRYQQSMATNRTSYNASHRYQKNHRQQIVHLAMPDTDTCKPQTTNRTSYHASHRYQQITGDKAFILPCLTQIPANHRQQMPHTDTSKS